MRQHIVTIVLDRLLSNSAMNEHRYLETSIIYTNLLKNVIIDSSIKLFSKQSWYPPLGDLVTLFQCQLAHMLQ